MKRRQRYIYILSVFAVFLFIFSMWSTASFLGVFDTINGLDDQESAWNVSNETNTSLQMFGNTSSGLSQKYKNSDSNGIIAIKDKYLYKSEKINEQFALTRIDMESGDRFPLITGYKCRNLIASNEYIYCIIDTTDKNKNFCNKIARVSIKGDDIKTFDITESSSISSMVADQDNIYYTKKGDRKIYKINHNGDIYSYIYELPLSSDEPYLFSILNGCLYYVDGQELSYIDLTNYTKTNISYQICSRAQNPFLEDGKIFAFGNLAKSYITFIDITTKIQKNIDIGLFGKNMSNADIDNLSYYKNNIFISSKNKLHYYNISSKSGGEAEDIELPSSIMYFNNDTLIIEDSEYGINSSEKIKWLLAK